MINTMKKHENSFGIVISLLLFVIGCIYVYSFIIDDAYISLRYAKNLVDYGSLSFNPTDNPVEGYTNFLLVMLEALFIKIGIKDVLMIPKLIGIVSGMLSIFLTYKISSQVLSEHGKLHPLLPTLATAVNASLIVWAVGGLETNLALLFNLCGIFYFISNMKSASLKTAMLCDVSFFLAFLSRPDSALLWAASYLYLLIFYKKVNWRKQLLSGVISGLLVGTYLIWKYYYFGGIIPLTFLAKVNSLSYQKISTGLFIFYSFFLKTNAIFLFMILLFFGLSDIKKRLYSEITYLLMLLVLFSIYVISLGSPCMNHAARFHVPLIPITYVLGTYGLAKLLTHIKKKDSFMKKQGIWLMASIVLVLGFYQIYTYWNVNFGWYVEDGVFNMKEVTEAVILNRDVSDWINSNVQKKGAVLATEDVGLLGYYTKGKILDTWSLTNKNIVLLRREQSALSSNVACINFGRHTIAKYILDQNPDLILLGNDDYSEDPRASEYVEVNLGTEYKHLFIKKDLLTQRIGYEKSLSDYRLRVK